MTATAVFFTNGTVNEESLVLLLGLELADCVHSLLTLVVRHTSSASWLGEGYV
jgi:hypothetical protein